MCNLKTLPTPTILTLLVGCALAWPSLAADNSKAPKAEKTVVVEESATIETITQKQRKIVLAELNKKLRDMNAGGTNAQAGAGLTAFPLPPTAFPLTPIPLPTATSKTSTLPTPPATVAAPAPRPLALVSVFGMGRNLSGTLSDGTTVKEGNKFSNLGKTWTVEEVNAQRLTAKSCNSAGHCESAALVLGN